MKSLILSTLSILLFNNLPALAEPASVSASEIAAFNKVKCTDHTQAIEEDSLKAIQTMIYGYGGVAEEMRNAISLAVYPDFSFNKKIQMNPIQITNEVIRTSDGWDIQVQAETLLPDQTWLRAGVSISLEYRHEGFSLVDAKATYDQPKGFMKTLTPRTLDKIGRPARSAYASCWYRADWKNGSHYMKNLDTGNDFGQYLQLFPGILGSAHILLK